MTKIDGTAVDALVYTLSGLSLNVRYSGEDKCDKIEDLILKGKY